ncbi:hypothetical protein IGI04_039297, partial [Brassica rapa subsp. trilocularis]
EQRTTGKRGTRFVYSSLVAEALALRSVVTECRRRDVKEVRFEADSAQLIQAINQRSPALEIYGIVEDIILEDIIRISEEFDVVVFSWIPRLRNCEADLLAKQALASFEQEVVVAVFMPPPN